MDSVIETSRSLCALDFAEPSATAGKKEPRGGEICPLCEAGRLDYDGLLNLICPNCGFTAAGGGGCT